MKKPRPLNPSLFCCQLDPKQLGFKTTDELHASLDFIGQERAIEAIYFGIGIDSNGYNLYAMGPDGIGKRSLIRTILKTHSSSSSPPPDWCYIYNFNAPDKPLALKLPPGLGLVLKKDMELFTEELKISLFEMFESTEFQQNMKTIAKKFSTRSKKFPFSYKRRNEEENALKSGLLLSDLQSFLTHLKQKYHAFSKIKVYFKAIEEDLAKNVNDFFKREELSGALIVDVDSAMFIKYKINLLVNNNNRKGVPVIFEDNPTYSNLIGRIEYKSHLGAFATDFTLVKPGSLHRANGGFLLLEARKLYKHRDAWEGLKNALYSKKLKIDMPDHPTESVNPISLKPRSIHLRIKIILLGGRNFYYKLCRIDPDFSELFKVAVDFDEEVERNQTNIKLYANLISAIVKRNHLRPFKASAVAAIIDYCTRLAEDIKKISTHVRRIDDLAQEANYWAGVEKKKSVDDRDVKQAITAQINRLDRSKKLYYEEILRHYVLINTKDHIVGQVNCLSVVSVGKFSYGHPTRVTAKARSGKGKILDIQREIKLSGPIHNKAGLIISNFLADRYCQDRPFSLAASLAFEQIYGSLEGDSASVGEVCALISALANIPINQCLAITGSINQHGEVQVIGGVNEKIEGYFDICQARGLDGSHGVIIPAINVNNLMLRDDVIAAARKKRFMLYPINTVDEAIYLLMGRPAGNRDKNGVYPKNSVNYLVDEKLHQFSRSEWMSKNKKGT